MPSTEVWDKAQMSDPKYVSAEATEGGSISVNGMGRWKLVIVARSGDDGWLVGGLWCCVSHCGCGSDCICC